MNIDKDNCFVPNLKEAHRNLYYALGEKVFAQYTTLLNQFFNFKINKIKFDEETKKLLSTPDQIRLHNVLLLSLSDKIQTNGDRLMYLSNKGLAKEGEKAMKYVTEERHVPDEKLVESRLVVTALKYDLDGADDEVAKMINIAVRLFLKNILTAVISKCSGFRIRENSFQHGIGFPVPNPWLRNYGNIVDETEVPTLDVDEEGRSIQPMIRSTLEDAQQQTAFSFMCGKAPECSTMKSVTLKGLYETLLEDPTIICNHTISSINLERILAKLECL